MYASRLEASDAWYLHCIAVSRIHGMALGLPLSSVLSRAAAVRAGSSMDPSSVPRLTYGEVMGLAGAVDRRSTGWFGRAGSRKNATLAIGLGAEDEDGNHDEHMHGVPPRSRSDGVKGHVQVGEGTRSSNASSSTDSSWSRHRCPLCGTIRRREHLPFESTIKRMRDTAMDLVRHLPASSLWSVPAAMWRVLADVGGGSGGRMSLRVLMAGSGGGGGGGRGGGIGWRDAHDIKASMTSKALSSHWQCDTYMDCLPSARPGHQTELSHMYRSGGAA